jgi:hypothetical protein
MAAFGDVDADISRVGGAESPWFGCGKKDDPVVPGNCCDVKWV